MYKCRYIKIKKKKKKVHKKRTKKKNKKKEQKSDKILGRNIKDEDKINKVRESFCSTLLIIVLIYRNAQ